MFQQVKAASYFPFPPAPNTNKIYIGGFYDTDFVTVIDGSTDSVIETVSVGTKPVYLDILY